MRKFAQFAVAVLASAIVGWAAPPAYRAFTLESAKGKLMDMYFERIVDTGDMVSFWTKPADEDAASKLTINRRKMTYSITSGTKTTQLGEIPPESMVSGMLDRVPVAKKCKSLYIPVFRKSKDEQEAAGGQVYQAEFDWLNETRAVWVTPLVGGKRLFYNLEWVSENGVLKHTLMFFECYPATRKYRHIYTAFTHYDKDTDQDRLISVYIAEKAEPMTYGINSPIGEYLREHP